MHISRLHLLNYRNFLNATFVFKEGVNTVIGENGSGKSNLFRALRLLLDDSMRRSASRLNEGDFTRTGKDWRGHWIIICIEFDAISEDEAIQALFLHATANADEQPIRRATYSLVFRPNLEVRTKLAGLKPGDHGALAKLRNGITISDYETSFFGRGSGDLSNTETYIELVGNFETVRFPAPQETPIIGAPLPRIFSLYDEISFTYIQALRDVVSEFRENRTNPLYSLLRYREGHLEPGALTPIQTQAQLLNATIERLDEVKNLRAEICDTLLGAAGFAYSPTVLSILSNLPQDPKSLFSSLRLAVAESIDGHPGNIRELSLGGANLLFLALKLLEFKFQTVKPSIANILAIEEPEAHIHVHIQKTLFENLSFPNTQIIFSTHSTNISEVSNVLSMNVLAKCDGGCQAFQPTNGLSPTQVGDVQRYLDAVRSNLLFAKSTLLVEGDAEEILIPILIKKVLGIGLDELGVSLVNIRSTGFENIAVLFHASRIKKRCAIITDLDVATLDPTPIDTDDADTAKYKRKQLSSQVSGARRKLALDAFVGANEYVDAFYANHTFEIDLLAPHPAPLVALLGEIYADAETIALAREELQSGVLATGARRILTIARQDGKGWLAVRLGRQANFQSRIPQYILNALWFAVGKLNVAVWERIFAHRLRLHQKEGAPIERCDEFTSAIQAYVNGAVDFGQVKASLLTNFPTDSLVTNLPG